MDVRTQEGSGETFLGWYFNGSICIVLLGRTCTGENCDDVFESITACEQAFVGCIATS